MRLILAASFLALLATPAVAQRIDTRVDEVIETSDGFFCRSHAYPELRISHDWRGGDRAAIWTGQARDSGATDTLHLSARFDPSDSAPFGVAASIPGFQLDLNANPLVRTPRAAYLRIDGVPDPTPLSVDGDRNSVTIAVVERLRTVLADRLMTASIVEIDITDGSVSPMRRVGWDVRKLRRIPELLQLINWSCR